MQLRTALIVSALALASGLVTPAYGAEHPASKGVFGAIGPVATVAETPEEQAEREHREAREREEQFKRETEKASENGNLHCVVPKLTGYSLARASRALTQSHCHLGLTNQPAGSRHHKLVVTGQRPKAGSHLVAGSAVSVTLGQARHRRSKKK